jgi:hypothetical protein
MRFEFVQTHREFAAAWLAEYYRAPRWGTIRVLGGPALAFFGWRLSALRQGDWLGLVGSLILGYGVYYACKPLVRVGLLVRRRHKLGGNRTTIVVEIGDEEVSIVSGRAETRFGWDRIRCAGWRSRYLWLEVGGARAIVPARAIADRAAVEEIFRAKGKWVGS